MSHQDNEVYLAYIDAHPNEFRDEPDRTTCGTMELRMIADGRLTREERSRRAIKRQKLWKEYHLAKAQGLGFDIDVEALETAGFRNFSRIE